MVSVLVVGGGPAGIAAALRARDLGAEVTLLESSRLGGTAFNRGPAPIRTLARAARLRADAALFSTFGLEGNAPTVDFGAVIANANRMAAHGNEVRHFTRRVRDAGVDVIDEAGPAFFVGEMALQVADGRQFEADRIILAVGGEPRRLSIPGSEHSLSFHDLWDLEELPERITVVGGSATGCQLASILIDLGAQVDLIEFADRLVPPSDAAISSGLLAAFTERGMNVLTGARSESIEAADGRFSVRYEQGGESQVIETDAVFTMVGWPANLSGLGLSVAGIATRGPYIDVDDCLRTNVPEILAVGDSNGLSMLVQSAVLQGEVAADNAVLDHPKTYTPHAVASGSFTNPEYGSVGLTEEQARASHDSVVEVVRHDQFTRAIIDATPGGMCKLIVDRPTRLVLGAHVLGPYSAEVVQVAATCMAAGMTVHEISKLEMAFPTFTQIIGVAAHRVVRKLDLVAPAWTPNEL